MSDKHYKKLVLILAIVAGIAVLSSILAGISDNENFIGTSAVVNLVGFALLFSVLSTRIEITGKVEKRIWLFSAFLLLLIIPGAIFDILPLIITPSILLLLLIGSQVFLPDRRVVTRLMLLMLFIVAGFILKKYKMPGAGVVISTALGILAAGTLILGIHILLTKKDNLYIRIVGSICSLQVAIGSSAILFKYQHWVGASVLSYMTVIPVLVITLLVLITLPGSGFITWKREQKQILTHKILIPWMFLLVFMALRILLPMPVQQRIFEKDPETMEPFEMFPYEIEMKDGMEEG